MIPVAYIVEPATDGDFLAALEGLPPDEPLTASAYDEAKHPRAGKGVREGGRWVAGTQLTPTILEPAQPDPVEIDGLWAAAIPGARVVVKPSDVTGLHESFGGLEGTVTSMNGDKRGVRFDTIDGPGALLPVDALLMQPDPLSVPASPEQVAAMRVWRGDFASSSNMRAYLEGRDVAPAFANDSGLKAHADTIRAAIDRSPGTSSSVYRIVPALSDPVVGDRVKVAAAAVATRRPDTLEYRRTFVAGADRPWLYEFPAGSKVVTYPDGREGIAGGDFKVASAAWNEDDSVWDVALEHAGGPVRAAGFREDLHPRHSAGSREGGRFARAAEAAAAAGFATPEDAAAEVELLRDNPQYAEMSDEDILAVQARLSQRVHGNSLSGLVGVRDQLKRTDLTPTEREEFEGVERRYRDVNKVVSARRASAEFAREQQAKAESAATGKLTLSKAEMTEVLGQAGDVYVDNKYQGDYNPDLFITSDLSGKPIRHYVTLPDGSVAHPDEIHESRKRGRLIVVPNVAAPRDRPTHRSDVLPDDVKATLVEEAPAAEATTAAGFTEAMHPRYERGDTRGGQFAPKDGTSSRAAQKEAHEAVAVNQAADAAAALPGQMQFGETALTAERSLGRDVRLTGKMADGQVYRVEAIRGIGSKGNTLVTLTGADGTQRQVFGFVEVEEVSGGFQAPDAPVSPAPAAPADGPTMVPGEPKPGPAYPPEHGVTTAPEPEPAPEPAPAPPPEPKPEPPAPPPPPREPKPVTPQVSNPTPPASPAVNRPVPVKFLKPGEKFRDTFGKEYTVVGPYKPKPRSYVMVEDENGQQRITRIKNTAYVDADHPAIAREQKTMVSHVEGIYGPMFKKTPGPGTEAVRAASEASLEAGHVIALPDDLPKIELGVTRSRSAAGQYWSRGAEPLKITLRPEGNSHELTSTMHHETGHYIDHAILGRDGRLAAAAALADPNAPRTGFIDRGNLYASGQRHPEVMGPVMDAIDRSEAIARVTEIATAPAGTYNVVMNENTSYERRATADRKHARYLLDHSEKWARAYEQYQAVKSGNRLDEYQREAALPRLSKDLTEGMDPRAYYGWYWTPEDFAPIEAEIDAMFGRLGWSKS